MKPLTPIAIISLGLCISAVNPMLAEGGVYAGVQDEARYTRSQTVRLAGVATQVARPVVSPGRPSLKVASSTCEERTRQWDRWYRVCLKECEDIAANYTFKTMENPATRALYRREFDTCIAACNSKNDYYRADLC
jgi:hypothetical protein